MEWTELFLSFVEKQTGHLVALAVGCAWAVVVLAVFYMQREAVKTLIESISEASLKIGNSEAKIGTRKIEELKNTVDAAEAIVAQTVPAEMPPLPPTEPPQRRVPDEEHELAVSEDREDEHEMLIEPPAGEKMELQAKQRVRFKFRDSAAYSAPSVVIERAWQDVRGIVFQLLGLSVTAQTWFGQDGLPDQVLISELKADPRVDSALLRAIVELKMVRNDATTTIGWQPTQREANEYKLNAQRVIGMVESVMKGRKPQ